MIRNRAGATVELLEGHLHYHCSGAEELSTLIEILKSNPAVSKLVAYHPDPKTLFHEWCENLKVIEAAGGLVRNNQGEYLFIFRKGCWDLPKGKIDKGESIKEAAVREVMEECGIKAPTISDELLTTYHIYELKGKQVLKPTYWFAMDLDENPELTPQLEEDITEAKWIPAEQIPSLMENTYPNIKLLIDHSLQDA